MNLENLQPESIIPASALIIVAHPDDAEFSAGGSVAKWTAAGAKVTYCIVTDGAAGSNDPAMTPEKLVALRREEQIKAAKIVGVDDVLFLGYPDGALQATLELRRHLTRLIRQLKPERVICFDPTVKIARNENYINHPDHIAASEAALYAVFPSAQTRLVFPELLAEGLEPHKVQDLYFVLSDTYTTYVDISDHIDQKLEALRCHASQLGEEVVQMVANWTKEAGEKVGCAHAEVFHVMNFREPPPA